MIVAAALDLPSSVAVTVAVPPVSEIDAGITVSVAVGASSSVIVPVAVAAVVESAAFVGLLNSTTTVSSASASASPATVTSRVLLLSPAAKVRVPAASAV